jgi:hypothetical protein
MATHRCCPAVARNVPPPLAALALEHRQVERPLHIRRAGYSVGREAHATTAAELPEFRLALGHAAPVAQPWVPNVTHVAC